MANTETTSTATRAWAPDLTAYAPADVVPDALILQTSTVAGNVEGDAPAVRVAFATDAAAGFVAEGAPIDEANPGLDECLVYTGKVSQLIRLSREQWAQPRTAEMLATSVQRAILRAANIAYLAQAAPVAPAVTPPGGLLNVVGIETAGDDVTGSLDNLVDLIATLEGNGGSPSHIIMAPDAWAVIQKMKLGADYNAPLLGAGTEATVKRLLGLPVLVSSAMTTLSGLVVDRTAIVSAVGQVQVATSEHVYFNTDGIALRATWRFGANVVHPDRIGSFVVADPAIVP
nr:phage major capsid protein [Propionibacterium sp.]